MKYWFLLDWTRYHHASWNEFQCMLGNYVTGHSGKGRMLRFDQWKLSEWGSILSWSFEWQRSGFRDKSHISGTRGPEFWKIEEGSKIAKAKNEVLQPIIEYFAFSFKTVISKWDDKQKSRSHLSLVIWFRRQALFPFLLAAFYFNVIG